MLSVDYSHGNCGYKRLAKSRGRQHEKSEEGIVPWMVETTELVRREGPLLQPRSAGR